MAGSQLEPMYCSQYLNRHCFQLTAVRQLTTPWFISHLANLSAANYTPLLYNGRLLITHKGVCGANTLLWAYMWPLTLESYFRHSPHGTVISWLSWAEMEPKQDNPVPSLY